MDHTTAIVTGVFLLANTAFAAVLSRRGKKRGDAIHRQLVPNGGASLRDHIDKRFDHIETRLDSQDARLVHVETKVGVGS